MTKAKAKPKRTIRDQKPKDDEEILFGVWGEENKKDDKSFVFEEGKAYNATITRITESDKGYRYIYKLQVEGVELPVLAFGNASLNNGMGRGGWDVETVEESDDVILTYEGKYTSKKSKRQGYKIKVQVYED